MYRLKSPIRSLTLTKAKLSNLNESNLGKNQEQIAHLLATTPIISIKKWGLTAYIQFQIRQKSPHPNL